MGSAAREAVYLKIDQNVLVKDRNVTLGDIASVTGSDEAMIRQLKQKKICSFPDLPGLQRKIFSILKIIELIQEDYPSAYVLNLWEKDFIVEYDRNPQKSRMLSVVKTVLLCVLVFFGGAFTIMSFNNDIGVTDLLNRFYYQVMGTESDGMTELEVSYCIGIAIGILVFFNHIGPKKITPDPTPIQVEMRKYEQDVDMTYIENAGRGGCEIDVD